MTARDPRRFDRTCARCGRCRPAPTRWPDGPICRGCLEEALRIHGRCPGCGYLRMLPGRNQAGEAVCTNCAGITRDFHCARCRKEGHLWAGRICTRCVLHDQLTALLDDGTGHTRPELLPLLESLHAMPQPDRGVMWLRNNPHLPAYLTGLARGEIPLSHAALHQLPSWRTAAHLRDLLMACGALPQVDRCILLYEQWYLRQLAAIIDPAHQRLLRQYATWDQLARLHAAARAGRLTTGTRNHAAEQFTCATRFLGWLATRGRQLPRTTQADIDDWHTTHPHHNGKLRGFLTWAITTGHAPPLDIPAAALTTGEPVTQNQRLALLRRVLTDDSEQLRTRVAACLVLLYAQPVSRLTRLTIDDILCNGEETLLRFGDPPSPVPEPFATLLGQLTTNRANMNTAANPHARWLFPGGRPGQPLTPGALLPSLRRFGIPITKARTAALRELAAQAPAPVIAQALGYSHTTTHKHLADAGGTWNHYPPLRDPGLPPDHRHSKLLGKDHAGVARKVLTVRLARQPAGPAAAVPGLVHTNPDLRERRHELVPGAAGRARDKQRTSSPRALFSASRANGNCHERRVTMAPRHQQK